MKQKQSIPNSSKEAFDWEEQFDDKFPMEHFIFVTCEYGDTLKESINTNVIKDFIRSVRSSALQARDEEILGIMQELKQCDDFGDEFIRFDLLSARIKESHE